MVWWQDCRKSRCPIQTVLNLKIQVKYGRDTIKKLLKEKLS